jgi:hypothetical protein
VNTHPEYGEMGRLEAHTDTLAIADATTWILAEPHTTSGESAREFIAIPVVAAQTELYRVAHKSVP